MKKFRPKVLAIAGFDPSSGAGITSDIKTIESLKAYGFGVCSAITLQNEDEMTDIQWIEPNFIFSQIEVLFKKHTDINFCKIGIIQNREVLEEIIDLLLEKNPKIKIILDPVLSSTSGFEFNESYVYSESLFSKLFMLTPNFIEAGLITNSSGEEKILAEIKNLSKNCNVYLKGGHREGKKQFKDELFTKNEKHFVFNKKLKETYPKHGTGCVLSSAIASYLALDFPLMKACYRAKMYTEKFLGSNKTILGYHR